MSRDELFARRRDDTQRNGQRTNGQNRDHESINIDSNMSHERNSLMNSHREIDDMLSQGSDIMGNLRHQRTVLTGARTKIQDIASTLGISNTVMQFIEKRASKDKVILYLGMTLFTLFMFLIWYYFL